MDKRLLLAFVALVLLLGCAGRGNKASDNASGIQNPAPSLNISASDVEIDNQSGTDLITDGDVIDGLDNFTDTSGSLGGLNASDLELFNDNGSDLLSNADIIDQAS